MQTVTTPFIVGMAAILFSTAAQAEPTSPPARFVLEAADGQRLVSDDVIGAILEIAGRSDAVLIRIQAVAEAETPAAPAADNAVMDASAVEPIRPAS
jgi:hypothetical protein